MKHSMFRSLLVVGLVGVCASLVASNREFLRRTLHISVQATDPIRGSAGDLWADVVIGQPNFKEGMVKERVAYKSSLPGGVHVDRSSVPNRMYVYDSGNSRILGYASLGVCANGGAACTTNSDCVSGGSCVLTPNKPADIVLGQANFQGAGCNRDSNFSDFPYLASPSAQTLCAVEAVEISPLEGGSYSTMSTDAQGTVYVSDWQNNRILGYTNPFAPGSDTTADLVIGQATFSGFLCNRGTSGYPTDSSICMGRFGGSPTNDGASYSFAGGTAVDGEGNLWVADTHNHRVLRFPKKNGQIVPQADTVLGQQNFQTRTYGNWNNQLHFPEAVEVDPSGNVYVVDGPQNHRVLKFQAPFTNGEMGSNWGFGFQFPTSIEYDPTTNGMWVSDNDAHAVYQFNLAGSTVQKVLYKDTYLGAWPPTAPCTSPVGYCYMQDTRGSIGITSDGDVWLSGSSAYQNVIRFPHPIPTPVPGVIAQPDFGLHGIVPGHNLLTGRSFRGAVAVAVSNSQVIAADTKRLLFWNNPSTLSTFKYADGVVDATGYGADGPNLYGRIEVDNANHLYTLRENTVAIYQLPLVTGATPIKIIQGTIYDLENNPFSISDYEALGSSGVAPDEQGAYIWLTQTLAHRAIRIRNPLSAHPVVDAVIGQLDYNDDDCNLSGNTQVQDYDLRRLCYPGAISMDSQHNVYISDATIEDEGNKRMLIFDADSFPTNNTQTIYAPVAHRIAMNGLGPLEVSFDSHDRAVVGFNDYQDLASFNPKHSLVFFENLKDSDAHQEFNEYFVMPYSTDFDGQNNFYVSDLNRARLLKYFSPFDSQSED